MVGQPSRSFSLRSGRSRGTAWRTVRQERKKRRPAGSVDGMARTSPARGDRGDQGARRSAQPKAGGGGGTKTHVIPECVIRIPARFQWILRSGVKRFPWSHVRRRRIWPCPKHHLLRWDVAHSKVLRSEFAGRRGRSCLGAEADDFAAVHVLASLMTGGSARLQ